MVRKQLTILGLAALLVLAGSMTALAEKFGGNEHHKGRCFLNTIRSLDLSETQKTRVAEIVSSYQNDMDAAHKSTDGIRHKLHDAMIKEPFDESAENKLRLVFKAASLIKEDIVVLRAKMMNEIRGTLTAEQQKMLSKMHEERMETRKDLKRSRMNCWLDSQRK